MERPGDHLLDTAALPDELRADGRRQAQGALRARQHREPSPKLVHLARPRVDSGDLIDHVARQRQATFQLLGAHLERRERLAIAAPRTHGLGDRSTQLSVPAVGIEQVPLPGW